MKNPSIVSYRVRLARNPEGVPFPHMLDRTPREALLDKLTRLFTQSAGGAVFTAHHLGKNQRKLALSLVEKHRISPEFAGEEEPHTVILSKDEAVSIMLCEEDHIRIQVFGDDPGRCYETAGRLEALADESYPLAFDEQLGYLTACPTNLGTGLRASALMHLPGLTETGAIRTLIGQATNGGLAVRGFYGEGTQAAWGYYQISNAVTLGLTEDEILSALTDIAERIDSHELRARETLRQSDPVAFEDRVWRAYGLLRHARQISAQEAMEQLSVLRMALPLGILPDGLEERIDRLSQEIWPYTLCNLLNLPDDSRIRDQARAEYLRSQLA